MTDLTKLSFDSRLNYLKRSEFVGSTNLTLPGAGLYVSHSVTHALGYVPFFIVGAELQDGDIVWSNDYVHELTQSSSAALDPPVTFNYWCTSSTLTIELKNGEGSGEQSGDRTVYWAIYLDYGGV